MEYLQYRVGINEDIIKGLGRFKPYYKWNTFNTHYQLSSLKKLLQCFKPYYKWNTFNTSIFGYNECMARCVCFKPYYKWNTFNTT